MVACTKAVDFPIVWQFTPNLVPGSRLCARYMTPVATYYFNNRNWMPAGRKKYFVGS